MLVGNTASSTRSNPLPLSDIICPDMLKTSPATGLAEISSTIKKVKERTLM